MEKVSLLLYFFLFHSLSRGEGKALHSSVRGGHNLESKREICKRLSKQKHFGKKLKYIFESLTQFRNVTSFLDYVVSELPLVLSFAGEKGDTAAYHLS